jgi:hypothetical protein
MAKYNCLNCGVECKVSHHKTNKFCSVKCAREHDYKLYISEWKAGKVDGRKGVSQTSNYIRRYLSEKFDETCQVCGIKEWNGQPITMQLEHLDGNSRNNKEDNLSLLCPNCHTQTEFYGSKNKGRGRGSLAKLDMRV